MDVLNADKFSFVKDSDSMYSIYYNEPFDLGFGDNKKRIENKPVLNFKVIYIRRYKQWALIQESETCNFYPFLVDHGFAVELVKEEDFKNVKLAFKKFKNSDIKKIIQVRELNDNGTSGRIVYTHNFGSSN